MYHRERSRGFPVLVVAVIDLCHPLRLDRPRLTPSQKIGIGSRAPNFVDRRARPYPTRPGSFRLASAASGAQSPARRAAAVTRIPRQTEIECGNEMAHPEGTFRLRYEQHVPFPYGAPTALHLGGHQAGVSPCRTEACLFVCDQLPRRTARARARPPRRDLGSGRPRQA